MIVMIDCFYKIFEKIIPICGSTSALEHAPVGFDRCTNIINQEQNLTNIFKVQVKVIMQLLRLVTCNRLVNLGISKQQHLYLKTKNLI